jgi:hypothetical protein
MAKAKNKTPAKTAARRNASKPASARLQALANGARLKKVGGTEFDLSDYVAVKSANGNSSLDNGDSVAKKLRSLDLEGVYKEYARVCGKEEAAAMRKRYAKLNPGMQRMNLGNRMRAALNNKAA